MLQNKRGTLDDKIYWLGAIVLLVVGIVALSLVWSPTYDALKGLGSNSVDDALDNVTPSSVNDWLDWLFVFAYFAFNILICIVLPFFVENNPIYIIALFFLSFFYGWIVAILSNALTEWLTSMGSTMSHMRFILDNLLVLEIVFILIMAIILFYKRQQPTISYY